MARTRRVPARRIAQLKYAALLSDAGRRGEAISLLLSMIEQHGDDPAVGKKAADTVKAIGSPEQVEQAYAALASHFPADASVWLRLGDARFAAEQDVPALDAYRFAAKADPGNAETRATLWLASRRFFAWIRPGEAWLSGNARGVGMRSCSVFWMPSLSAERLRRSRRQSHY